jgi:hypothetical protein
MPKPLLSTLLSSPHAFFTRAGGVSEGLYASLNVGVGSKDNPDHVRENRARAAAALGFAPEQLRTVYQVHSPDVLTLTKASSVAVQADAMVTRERGLLLGILTADCAPVLFADTHASVIGAAHAGWKGAFTGVLENTVAAMEGLGARRSAITAVIGPCIAQSSYEVGPEFVARLCEADPSHAAFFIPSTRADHSLFDLPAYVHRRLLALGLQAIEAIAMDTAALEADFFSYRRATLRGDADYGRQLSAIGML